MVPKSEHAFWLAGWVGSTELRRLLALHAQTLRTRDGHPLRLNHRELKDDRVPRDDHYRGARVTRHGLDAPLVPHERLQADYVDARAYPEEEADIWPMLRLPYRPFEDRNA